MNLFPAFSLLLLMLCLTVMVTGKSKNYRFGTIVTHHDSTGLGSSQQIIMNNHVCLPLLAFGTYQLGNDTVVKKAIRSAIESGFRLIDTAYIYKNEETIGEVLQEIFRDGQIHRTDLFVTTKVWNNHQSKEKVKKSIRDSLKKLRLDYLDLVLLHYPTGFQEDTDDYPKFSNGSIIPRTWKKNSFIESWEAMEDSVRYRLVRSIGVSNFNRAQMKKLLDKATIKPVLNQVESHPNLKQKKLYKYLFEKEILMQAYAPIRRADKQLLNDPILMQIAQKYNKTTAQIALRWQLERKVPIVVKSSNPIRIRQNIDVFDFHLNPEDINAIESLPEKERIYNIPGIETHPDYPFNEE